MHTQKPAQLQPWNVRNVSYMQPSSTQRLCIPKKDRRCFATLYMMYVDAKAIAETGVKSIQLHTGGMCHLDAEMTRQGVESLGVDDVDLAILENVGNLVCPAEFDTGAVKNVMILSVPEGHDKPLKYPLMFQVCDAVLINKMDVLPYFDFDMDLVKTYIHQRNPQAEIFPISAKTGEGITAWTDWLYNQVIIWKE